MALQAITIAEGSFERAKLHDDFIRAMVFPGGCLPSVAAIAGSVARTSDLRIVDLEDIGPHYAETLRRWRDNLERRRAEVERLGFDEPLLATVDPVPVLLRGGVHGAPHLRRAARPGEAARHLARRRLARSTDLAVSRERRSRSSMTSARLRASPPLQTAPSGAACSSPAMPPPPTSTGRPGLTDRTARTIARRERSWFPEVTATATANGRGVLVTAAPNASAGTSAPRSTTS